MSCVSVDISRLLDVYEQRDGVERRISALTGLVEEETIKYWVFNKASQEEAQNAVKTYLSTTYPEGHNSLFPVSIAITENKIETGGAYSVAVTFKALDNTENALKSGLLSENYVVPAIKESQIVLAGGGETEHIDFGEEHLWSGRDDSWTPYDYAGAIDYYQGNIGGFDRPDPGNGSLKIAYPVPKTYFKQNNREMYKKFVALIGSVNSDTFASFDSGWLLFSSFDCSPTSVKGGEDSWYFSVNLNFLVKAPQTLTVGSSTYEKEGHDYAWWSSTRQEYTASGTGLYVPKKTQLNVERVYPRASFSVFGLTFEE